MTTFFTADTHFNDGTMRSREFVNRPFKNTMDHDLAVINKWNRVVSPGDTVFHLGDFAHENTHRSYLRQVFDRLNGRKILIVGNHDTPDVLDLPWSKVALDGYVRTQRHEFQLGHKPPQFPVDGMFYLHGHLHTRAPNKPSFPVFDVGLDGHAYEPWSEHDLDRLAALYLRGKALFHGLLRSAAL